MICIYLLILAFLSFFFSGSEAALTSLSDYKIRKLYLKYNLLKTPLQTWILKPYRFIITILIGNTLVNLLFSSISTRIFFSLNININKELKEFIVWFLTTFVLIVFCELIPKIISKNFSERISKISLFPLYVIQYFIFVVFSPILFFIEKYFSTNNIFYLTKTEEIKKILKETSKEIFRRDITEYLERAIRFNEVRIKDIYTPKEKVLMIDISKKNFQQILTELLETGKTRIPIYNENYEKILGYILIKDLFYICSTEECNITDIIHPILEVNLNDKAKDLLKKFKETQIHIAKVVDNNKRFQGIVTLEDIIEELVGEILDEYDIRTIR